MLNLAVILGICVLLVGTIIGIEELGEWLVRRTKQRRRK